MKITLKLFIALAITLFLIHDITAQTIPESVQESHKVKSEIDLDFVFKDLNQKGIDRIDVTIDNASVKVLDTASFFQIKTNELRIHSQFLNPMKYKITVNKESLDDELFTIQQEFLTSAIGNLPALPPAGARPVAGAVDKMDKELMEALLFAKSVDANFIINNPRIQDDFVDIKFFELQKDLDKNSSSLFNNLLSINKLSEIQSKFTSNNTTIATDTLAIRAKAKKLNTLRKKMNQTVIYTNGSITKDELKAYMLLKIDELIKKISESQNNYAKILKSYNTYTKLFKNIQAKKTKTVNNITRYELDIIEKLTRKKKRKVTIKIEEYSFNAKDKSLKVKSTKTYVLNIRIYRAFIPVISSGVIYSNLSFASYGTDTDDLGNTVVSRSSNETNEITLGAYLNMYLNNDWENPMFWQFGVGPSKEKPLFFLGGGISIGNRINISTGAVFTWFPTLNDLSEGDIVSGTSIIDKDISYEFSTKPKFYIGLNFDISKK